MNRKEFNEKFINELENVSSARLIIASKVRRYEFENVEDCTTIKKILREKHEADESSWCVNEVAHEYNRIKDLDGDNLQIWANYRKYNNVDAPIAKSNGDFLAVSFKGVTVDIDGQPFSVTSADHISVPANHYSENGEYVTINYATMEKLLQIRGHLSEIARLVN